MADKQIEKSRSQTDLILQFNQDSNPHSPQEKGSELSVNFASYKKQKPSGRIDDFSEDLWSNFSKN